ncbi:MAG: glycoside hydrolase family 88 protein [Clostridia bacterium]|nr:glycoside hydrolase family 88 protein [Clostridia bacterium]MBR2053806.1 glycoside hydrolase family 88 protein [Clostridia bacterium]
MYQKINDYVLHLIRTSSPEKTAWNIERARQGLPATWNYIDGCMLGALLEMTDITGDPRFADFVEYFVDSFVSEDGSIRTFQAEKQTLDDINEGKVLFPLYRMTGKEKYRRAMDTLQRALDAQPRTYEGSWWHKKIYPHQVWLDGIYMAQVFRTLYEKHVGNGDYSDVIAQIRVVRNRMFDEKKRLYYHGYDASKTVFWADKETGLSQSFWLRAMGWFAAALVDIADILPESEAKTYIAGLLHEMMEGILPYADDETGLYWQVVDQGGREGNYLETSGSSMMAYAMLKGARLGFLPKKYAVQGKKTFDGIVNRYLSFEGENLVLGGICLVAGLGPESDRRRDGTYAYYISEPVVQNDAKGAAPFVMCYTEVKRLIPEG